MISQFFPKKWRVPGVSGSWTSISQSKSWSRCLAWGGASGDHEVRIVDASFLIRAKLIFGINGRGGVFWNKDLLGFQIVPGRCSPPFPLPPRASAWKHPHQDVDRPGLVSHPACSCKQPVGGRCPASYRAWQSFFIQKKGNFGKIFGRKTIP